MAFRKMRCPRCKGKDTKYLDKVARQTAGGERYEKVYWCAKCEKTFNIGIEVPYGYGTRKAKR